MSDPRNYTVGWICAILPEFVAAQEFLDEEHEGPSHVASGDKNTYCLGRIHKHNIAIAALPDGRYGTSTAAAVAISMLHSFPNIRIGLMVGIAGGAPTADDDIRLGDIVVSAPRGDQSGVFQYDFGKTIQGQKFHYTKHLDKPPTAVLTAVSSLRAKHERRGHNIAAAVKERVAKLRRPKAYSRPDAGTDVLYRSEIIHVENERLCATACGTSTVEVVPRNPRDEDEDDDDPTIHYGLVASADQLMKDATVRDRLASEKRVLCFEMEAAGLMDNFPCLVVRGICDYSDTHKNKAWQGYAAMTAAAYARELLYCVSPSQLELEKTVSEAIALDVHEMKKTMTSNKETAEDNKIMAWLSATHPSNKRNEVEQRRHPGSGGWLMDDTRYKTWKHTPGSFLWLSGMAGCGKTFLSSAVVDDMQRSGLRVIYFYFQFDDNTRRKVDHILRSLISQSYWMTDKAKAYTKDMRQRCDGHAEPTANQLYDCLVSILNSDEYWVIVDALDECPNRQGSHTEGVLQFIKSLREDTQEHTHVLVTSRAEQDIRDSISQWGAEANALQLKQGLVSQDIESYVTHQLATREGFKRWDGRPDLVQEIKDTILNKADGMFRWVACQLDSLEQCLDPRSLKTALKSLPTGLDETYSRMIEAIPEERKSAAINILRILIFSNKPPRIEELVDALAIDVTEEPTPRFDRDLRMPNPMEITNYCPSLVVTHQFNTERTAYYDDDDSSQASYEEVTEVHLAHFSVKEFLTSDRLSDELKDCMDSDASRAYLTTICVTYLSGIREKMSQRQILDVFPFAEWSARAWWEHAAGRRQVKNKKIDDLIVNFLLFNKEAYLNSLRVHIPDTSAERQTMRHSRPPAWGLYYACQFGMAMDVENLLRHSPNVNAFGGVGGYPIHAAAEKGHVDLVQLLLSKGAAVDLLTRDGLTPLHLAARYGNEETVQHLLNANADIHAIGWCNETVLGLACYSGDLSMVKRFVKLGVDIGSSFGVAALANACSCGYEDIVQFLIDSRIDPHTYENTTITMRSPIGEAALKGYERIVQICLNVNFRGTITMTSYPHGPLYEACREGHVDIVRMILDAGEDVGAPEQEALVHPRKKSEVAEADLNELLMLACKCSKPDMIFLLLDRGADVNYVTRDGETVIVPLLEANHHELCRQLLDKGYQVNLAPRDKENQYWKYEGCPALAAACENGNEDMARTLLQRGADVNTKARSYDKNDIGLCPILGRAIIYGHTGIVELLMEFGVDTKPEPLWAVYHAYASKTDSYSTWFMSKFLLDLGGNIHGPVRTACFYKRVTEISMMHGWGVMVGTGLPVACHGRHLALVQFLLDVGADPDTEDIGHGSYDSERSNEDSTERFECYDSLRAASYGGYADIVQLLLDRGARVNRREANSINTPPTTTVSHSEAAHDISGVGYGKALQQVIERHEGICYPEDHILGDFADALQAACYQGHEDVIRVLIAKGVDVNFPRGILGSAIAAASLSGQYGSVRLLLAAGANAGGNDGRALVAALVGGHEEIVSLLCEPDVGLTAEHREMAFWESVGIDNECSSKYALENIQVSNGSIAASGIDKESWYNERHFQALHIAIKERNIGMVLWLLKLSADITSPACRYTNLFKATDYKFPVESTPKEKAFGSFDKDGASRAEVISFLLLDHNIDLNWSQERYDDALLQSAKMGFAELIQVLLDRGASYSGVKEWPVTALQMALDREDYDLICASNNSGAKIVDHVGNNPLFSIEAEEDTSVLRMMGEPHSTLLYAAAVGRTDVVRLCMSAASDINIATNMGATPLHFAACHGHTKIIQTLLDVDASTSWIKSYINTVTEQGVTPLHAAAIFGQYESLRVLLESGANPTIPEYDGRLPLTNSKDKIYSVDSFERYAPCVDLLNNWKDIQIEARHQKWAVGDEVGCSLASSSFTVEERNACARAGKRRQLSTSSSESKSLKKTKRSCKGWDQPAGSAVKESDQRTDLC